jgi:ribosomal protein S18 acetylase RimI-like enzyme
VTFAVVIEPLSPAHDRNAFACGVATLDRYFREQASQDVRRRVSNCFVAVEQEAYALTGYYTLAASSVPNSELPATETRRLPRYSVVPAALIGRLAVDTRYRGRQLGITLVADAARRAARSDPAAFMLLVDAKDHSAAAFYRKLGFMPLASRPLTLFLPIATALKLFS